MDSGPVRRNAIPDNRDDDEYRARILETTQQKRWVEEGRQITFFQRDEEFAILDEIRQLKKKSPSYQRRYGYPTHGISKDD